MSTTPSWVSAAAAQGWRAMTERRREANAPVYALAFREARLAPGMRVLDVGAGTGDQTLAAARIVGPSGSVLATDISAAMLAILEEDARSEGLANVETRVADAGALDLPPGSFDAAVSGNCLQFVPDPLAALRGIRAALAPGARLAAIVGSSAERSSPLLHQLRAMVHRLRDLPPPGPETSGFSALGAPGRFEGLLREAGFGGVRVEAVPTLTRYASRVDLMRTMEGNANMTALLDLLDGPQRAAALAEVEAGLGRFESADGLALPNEMLVGSGSA